MSEENEYGIIIKFTDGSDSFCHGYECGMIHWRMHNKESIEAITVHTANVEQIKLMAAHFQYEVDSRAAVDENGNEYPEYTFLDAWFSPKRKGLQVIQGGVKP